MMGAKCGLRASIAAIPIQWFSLPLEVTPAPALC